MKILKVKDWLYKRYIQENTEILPTGANFEKFTITHTSNADSNIGVNFISANYKFGFPTPPTFKLAIR